ncbi:MAG: 2-oxo acid dehydrogenase subunit E2 [Thermomicrobiales bacterium]|nr:2-oxo acid dehydrogenase subunit E2 [Thermomicrobiales bacterium]
MPTVIMPKMGDAMEEGTLLRWLKQVGEDVAVGDPIAEIETDKVTLEIEAADEGVLSQTLVPEGAVVPIGAPIATIGEEDAPVVAEPALAAAAPVAAAPAAAPVAVAAPAAVAAAPGGNGATPAAPALAVAPAPGAADGERLRASPLVKRLAAEHGIDLSRIAGSGPGGRIVKDDITPYLTGAPQAVPAAPAVPAPAPVAPVPAPIAAAPAAAGRPAATVTDLSRIKRTTGKRMLESVTTAPHFFVTIDVDMGAAVAFREQVNAQVADGAARISFNDLVVKAAALALRDFPNLNSSLENDRLHTHPNIDINVAVALPDGLIAPFIPDADQKSLGAIARMAKDLIGRARDGGLQPNEYQGGTFTVSNLGMYDVDEFISIINPPQAAILAVGSIREVPVVRDGEIVPGRLMKLTLSADHRVTDGAESARFLQATRRLLENPMLLALG